MAEDDKHEALWDRIHRLEEAQHNRDLATVKELAKIGVQLTTVINLAETFVTKERFLTVQILVYGFAGIILTGVIGALLALVLGK